MNSGLVYMLVLLGYTSTSHTVTSVREMSWHNTHAECVTVMQAEQTRGRRESYNYKYFCMPVVDHEMDQALDNNARKNYPRSYGSGNLQLRW